MKKLIALLLLLASTAQGESPSPCYWSGQTTKCFPTTGIYLNNSRTLRLGTDNETNYVELAAPASMVANKTFTFPATYGGLSQVLTAADTLGALGWSDPGATTADVLALINQTGARRYADIVCHTNITPTGTQTCDGQSTAGLFLALLMGQSSAINNGLWYVDDFGFWTQLTTVQTAGGLFTVTDVGAGTTYSNTLWLGYGDGGTTNNFFLIPTTASNTQLTASRAVTTDSTSHLTVSATTATELGYVNGVTSAIQTQLNAKTSNPGTTTGDVFYCSDTATPCTVARRAIGASTTVLHGGTTPSYSQVAIGSDVSGLGSNVATWLGTPSSSNLAAAVTDETGSGALVFGTAPTITLANGTGLPLTTGVTGTLPVANGGTGITSFGTGVATWLGTPSSANLASAVTDETGSGALVFGTAPTITLANGTGLPLTTGVTGILPMANGGTNKNATAVNGGLVWSDADSFEITAAGTSQNWVLSGGAGTPTMSNTTTTGKFVDGSADEIQMRVQGHSTQTSNILTVEKSDATLLLNVTNTTGTAIKGTTTNGTAAAGYVGETIRTDKLRSAATSLTSASTTNIVSVTLTAGDWDLTGVFGSLVTGTTSVTAILYAISTTSATLPSGNDSFAVPNAGGEVRMQWASSASVPANDITYQITSYAVNISATTTFYLVVNPTFSISTMSGYGMLQARRAR